MLGAWPAEGVETPAYGREVQTEDGGRYRAFVYGAKLSQPTTERASIVGIAVDDLVAVDERRLSRALTLARTCLLALTAICMGTLAAQRSTARPPSTPTS